MKFTATIKDGQLKLHDKEGFSSYLDSTEGDIWIDIKKAPKARSSQQNAYYRHIIRQIGNHLGYSEDEMHEVIKERFRIESTKDLNVEEFSELLDSIIRFSATLGFVVEDPRKS
tara:strand:+ start:568 stop:909 length:342 start_codon:yes stop_codon:yes gene_type:complete